MGGEAAFPLMNAGEVMLMEFLREGDEDLQAGGLEAGECVAVGFN